MGSESDCFYVPVNCLETHGKGIRLFLHPSVWFELIWPCPQTFPSSSKTVGILIHTRHEDWGTRSSSYKSKKLNNEISFWGHLFATCVGYLFEHIYHGISVWTLYTMVWLFEHVYNGIFFWTGIPWYVYLNMYAIFNWNLIVIVNTMVFFVWTGISWYVYLNWYIVPWYVYLNMYAMVYLFEHVYCSMQWPPPLQWRQPLDNDTVIWCLLFYSVLKTFQKRQSLN